MSVCLSVCVVGVCMVCVGGASRWLGVCSKVVMQRVTEGDRETERECVCMHVCMCPVCVCACAMCHAHPSYSLFLFFNAASLLHRN
jgi:hypothetical protein